MITIVFSKDRALQLDAFLRSYKRHVTPLESVHVLYTASTDRHLVSYREVFKRHEFAVPCLQECFKQDVLALVPQERVIVFFVDDQIFTHPWTVLEKPGLSLRLGLNITENYASGSATQPLPQFVSAFPDLFVWRWSDGELAWHYPLSVDGHVFNASMIRSFLELIDFGSPNQLESKLQTFVHHFELGFCYEHSRVVNVPWTRVQTDWANRFDGLSADALLDHWERGQQIDLSRFDGMNNKSVHESSPLYLEERL